MASNAKNVVKRLMADGNLTLYHDYRIRDPETGTGSILDHSGNGNHGTLSASAPTWSNGFTFADDQYIQVADSQSLDDTFGGDGFCVVVLVDEFTSDHSDTDNTGQDYRDFATHVYRRNPNGPTGKKADVYSGLFYYAPWSWRCLALVAAQGYGIWGSNTPTGSARIADVGSRVYTVSHGTGYRTSVNKRAYAEYPLTYAPATASSDPLYIGNANRNPRLGSWDLGDGSFRFPSLDKIQAVMLIDRMLTDEESIEIQEWLLAFNSGDLRQQFGSQGGTRLEFVYHVLGYPYGLSTSRTLADAIDVNLNIKRRIYGLSNGSSYYPADTCPTFDLLEPPQSQSMKVDFKKSKLSGGNWKARVSNQQLGYAWPHRANVDASDNTSVSVLDGIATLPSVSTDESINWGTIRNRVDYADTTINFYDKSGDDLADKVSNLATASKKTTLFLGNETVVCTGRTDMTDYFRLDGVIRGAYKSKVEAHFLEDYRSANKKIADAPLGGAAGRYYELYAIPVDDATGAITDEPFLMRYGQIQNDVTISRDSLTIACGAFNTAIEKNIKIETQPGQLAKFVLSRPNVGCSATPDKLTYTPTPHIMIAENGYVEGSAGVSQIKNIWLCPQGSSVTFDTLDDLIVAIQKELNLCTSADTSQQSGSAAFGEDQYIDLAYEYVASKEGIFCIDPESDMTVNTSTGKVTLREDYPSLGGLLPWLLGLFTVHSIAEDDVSQKTAQMIDFTSKWGAFTTQKTDTFDPDNPQSGLWTWAGAWRNMMPMPLVPTDAVKTGDGNTMQVEVPKGISPSVAGMRSRYIYQPDFEAVESADEAADFSTRAMGVTSTYPMPATIYTVPGFDASNFENAILRLGQPGGGGRWGRVNATTVTQSGEFDAITLVNSNNFDFELDNSTPAMLMKNFGPEHAHNWKRPLYWIPGPNDLPDPWQITLDATLESDDLRSVLMGICGDDVHGITVPERMQLQGVPWVVDDQNAPWISGGETDFHEAIDWVSYHDMVQPFSEAVYYRATLGGDKFNFGRIFWDELLFHGVSPVWAPDFVDRMWKIRFRRMGAANETRALWEGRSIDRNSIVGDGEDSVSLLGSSRLSELSAKFGWDPGEGKFLQNINVAIRGGEQISADNKLAVKSMLTQMNSAVSLSNPAAFNLWANMLFSRILKNFIESNQSYSTAVIQDKLWDMQPGADAQVTDPGVPNTLTGEIGLSQQAVIIEKVKTSFSRPKEKLSIDYRLTPNQAKAIAPSMIVPANSSSKDASKVTITPSEHAMSGALHAVDLSYFDCLSYDPNKSNDTSDAANYVERSCGCGDFIVQAFRTDQTSPTVMNFTVKSVDIDAGTCELWGTTTNWDTTKEHVVLYRSWDTAGLQPCQMTFIAYGDANNELVDSSGNKTRTPRWV